jgi:hypothetical protein
VTGFGTSLPKEHWVMGVIHRYLERRRVLRLLAELEKSLCRADRPRQANRLTARRATF